MRENDSISNEEERILELKFKGKSILVVEDEFVSSQLILRILKKYMKVDVASTSDECFARILETDYHLIFMDINLGYGLSGLDIVKSIRGIEAYKKIPIIATTAFAMTGDKEEIIEAGCTDYLSKPFTKVNILNLIKEIKI